MTYGKIENIKRKEATAKNKTDNKVFAATANSLAQTNSNNVTVAVTSR